MFLKKTDLFLGTKLIYLADLIFQLLDLGLKLHLILFHHTYTLFCLPELSPGVIEIPLNFHPLAFLAIALNVHHFEVVSLANFFMVLFSLVLAS